MDTDRIIRKLRPHLEDIFRDGPLCRTGPLPLSAEALIAWGLRQAFERTVVFVTDGRRTLDLAHRDMETLAPDATAGNALLLYCPAREILAGRDVQEDPDIAGYRFQVLQRLSAGDQQPALIATCIQTLMQRAVSPTILREHSLPLRLGHHVEIEQVMASAAELGYEAASEVNVKGQICAKGGLIDIWPVTCVWPVRVEFLGSQIESMRTFDPAGQLSLERVEEVLIAPSQEMALMQGEAATVSFADYLPRDTLLLWSNHDFIQQHAQLFYESARDADSESTTVSFEYLQDELIRRRNTLQILTGHGSAAAGNEFRLEFEPLPGIPELPRRALAPDVQEAARQRLVADLCSRAAKGQSVCVYFETRGAEEHFRKTVVPEDAPGLHARVGSLSTGFICDQLNLVVVADTDVYGQRDTRGRRYVPAASRGGPERIPAARIGGLADIEPGDLVVHIEHGLGKYLGLFDIMISGRHQEVLSVEYADHAKLHIPVSQAHLLSRYVGVSPHRVRLHRLGGRRWNREKADAQDAIVDLASSLLELQAERSLLNGHAFPANLPWQHEFGASFPYSETKDQTAVIEEVQSDMESAKPMDRLVCGDAGYGKTEVAMRAAFRAVMDAKQVVVLVPTTILAQQHFDTFRERMAGYPIRVEMLSRFRTARERGEVIRNMQAGTVDIVIGTHALLQPGIAFSDLGLVIIDEEQRFGVVHKERLKEFRRLVDVLTMTATPIPRTLYMSLTGARDISLLQTPPRERMAIETAVIRNSEEVVRKALVRELNREGQAFYLHNRVLTIDSVRQRLEALVPEARFGVAHGQMPTSDLESVMHRFVTGEFDVLICTTIIESGMDIPRVNTILVDRADRFGIADLYQLRGRVGRSSRKAYAYLLLPPRGYVEPDARRRIAALQKFSGLSAGFNLAMRDLEIRGAGNLLGVAQSGHINALGFGLYCQLLNRTVAGLKNKPLPPIVDVIVNLDFISLASFAPDDTGAATIPYEYIEDEHLRVEIYRKIAQAAVTDDIQALRKEVRDRFGPAAPAMDRLLTIADLRIVAAQKGIVQIETRKSRLMLKDEQDYLMQNKRFPRLSATDPDQKLEEVMRLVATCDQWPN